MQAKTGFTAVYDRLDLHLDSMDTRAKLEQQLKTQPPTEIAGAKVIDVLAIDGYKFRLDNHSWLIIRFSGTEPVLRLYSEAPTVEQVKQNLQWAKTWAT